MKDFANRYPQNKDVWDDIKKIYMGLVSIRFPLEVLKTKLD